jgi:hypothetical protein
MKTDVKRLSKLHARDSKNVFSWKVVGSIVAGILMVLQIMLAAFAARLSGFLR